MIIKLIHSPHVKTGKAFLTPDTLIVGIGPLTEVERAGYHARYLVNQGLRDIVRQLGEVPLPANPENLTIQMLRTAQRKYPYAEFTDGSVI